MQPAYLFNHYNGQYSIGELVDFDAQVTVGKNQFSTVPFHHPHQQIFEVCHL